MVDSSECGVARVRGLDKAATDPAAGRVGSIKVVAVKVDFAVGGRKLSQLDR